MPIDQSFFLGSSDLHLQPGRGEGSSGLQFDVAEKKD
jgi:hypothetical protein